jgi:hypothetical protein
VTSSLQHRHQQPFISLDKVPYDKHGDDGVTMGGKTGCILGSFAIEFSICAKKMGGKTKEGQDLLPQGRGAML